MELGMKRDDHQRGIYSGGEASNCRERGRKKRRESIEVWGHMMNRWNLMSHLTENYEIGMFASSVKQWVVDKIYFVSI